MPYNKGRAVLLTRDVLEPQSPMESGGQPIDAISQKTAVRRHQAVQKSVELLELFKAFPRGGAGGMEVKSLVCSCLQGRHASAVECGPKQGAPEAGLFCVAVPRHRALLGEHPPDLGLEGIKGDFTARTLENNKAWMEPPEISL